MDQVLQNLTRKSAIAAPDRLQEVPAEVLRAVRDRRDERRHFGAVIPVFGPDYQTYFTTKWKKEFRTK